jgi:hypothetical protein
MSFFQVIRFDSIVTVYLILDGLVSDPSINLYYGMLSRSE